jgi:ribosomal protein L11 methyltransferase
VRRWLAMSVLVPRKDAENLGARLVALGATGVQEDLPPGATVRWRQPWEEGPPPPLPSATCLRAWFEERPTEAALRAVLGTRELTWTEQEEEDWATAWRAHFRPVVVSERLTVAAPWHGVRDALLIEPGLAFGTGDHGTTRALLGVVDRHARPGGSLLDVGTGSGILALAGAKLGMRATGVDIDPDAVTAAREAAARNGLTADLSTTPVDRLVGPFDLVVANLYAEVIAALAGHLARLARGPVGLAGILADREHLVLGAFDGWTVTERASDGDWVALVLERA